MPAEERFGSYRLIRPAGSGGMALVHLAERLGDPGPYRRCVVKRLSADSASDPDTRGMFIEESRLSALLEHPNIVRTFDVGEVNGTPYIAMEFVDGMNLLQLSTALGMKQERLSLGATIDMAIKVADALDFAHRLADANRVPLNLVHRDVSPQNILLSREGDVKLTDFGIARHDAREHETMGAQVKGKMGYMAPEQWRGAELDGRVDLFALGLVIVELLIGEKLIRSYSDILDVTMRVEKRLASMPNLNPRFRRLLVSMVQSVPEQRPQTAKDVAQALERVRSELPPSETLGNVVVRVLASLDPSGKLRKFSEEVVTADLLDGGSERAPGEAKVDATPKATFTLSGSADRATSETFRMIEMLTRESSFDDPMEKTETTAGSKASSDSFDEGTIEDGYDDQAQTLSELKVSNIPKPSSFFASGVRPPDTSGVEPQSDDSASNAREGSEARTVPPRRPSSLSGWAQRVLDWVRGAD